jgi:hypothetical protein
MKPNSFLYQWYDSKSDMYYIGAHKGCIADGYICSSKVMLEQYKNRPVDFVRTILAFGEYSQMIIEETKLLKNVNASKNSKYYNMHNGDGNFFCKYHTESTKNLISSQLKKYKKTKKHCDSISNSKKGVIPPCTFTRQNYIGNQNPNFGKKRPEVGKINHIKFSKKYIVEGIEYLGLSEIMKKYNLKSKACVHYRIKSNSAHFKEWNYGN